MNFLGQKFFDIHMVSFGFWKRYFGRSPMKTSVTHDQQYFNFCQISETMPKSVVQNHDITKGTYLEFCKTTQVWD